ncbi:MAG: hypothetical protein HRT71_02860 [Flavobacteriales bacterium]|nr:hypothetical protein [Flavobacteriales bacterium]
MKKTILFSMLLSALVLNVEAQSTLRYFLDADFTEKFAQSTNLDQHCDSQVPQTSGTFTQELFANCSNSENVYNFDYSCGFNFMDGDNGNLLGCEYTITMHWKFDQNTAIKDWQRLIGWSNFTSDDGMYVEGKEGGTFEFWPIDGKVGNGIAMDDE